MAKVLKVAAIVVGAVALVASGVGALGGLGIVAAHTATLIGTVAGLAAAGLSAIASAVAAVPKGTLAGSPTKFTIDKESGIPYVMGRTASGGRVVHRQYYGPKDAYESWAVVHSTGPVKSIGPLLIDRAEVPQSGTAVGGSYAGYMWLDTQLGACPETRALAGPQGAFPGWDATSKLSGLAADLWTLKFDTNGKVFAAGIPQRLRVLEGVYVYDPRLDDTYPGGAGPCRLAQEETYVWSENPALHAITWGFGRYQNGVLVAGGGLGAWGIDLPPFVEWANVCDANGWKVGGTVYTTSDNKWDVLKMIAQAGAAEVMVSGALLSCIFSAPRVSIGTLASADIAGDLDIPSTASMRDRRNTIIPKVRLESQGWEVVPIKPVSVPDYVALDGAKRPKEISYPLVQDEHQGAQIAAYDLLNMREIDGMVLPAKIYALGYRPGDCLTLDIPEANLIGRDVIVRQREIDGSTMGVTLTCRSETPGKHAFALGQVGVPPRTPDLSVPARYPVEAARGAYTAGIKVPAAPFTSDDTTITIAGFSATLDGGLGVIDFPAGSITGLSSGTIYGVFRSIAADARNYEASEDGTAELNEDGTPMISEADAGGYYFAAAQGTDALNAMASSNNMFVGWQATSSGGSYPTPQPMPPGYGGDGSSPRFAETIPQQ